LPTGHDAVTSFALPEFLADSFVEYTYPVTLGVADALAGGELAPRTATTTDAITTNPDPTRRITPAFIRLSTSDIGPNVSPFDDARHATGTQIGSAAGDLLTW
jgi:hypothetical protein